ncbi:MAG TPA: hypothetical protein VIX63_03260 [Vicinamibacterales bacterium]
MIERIPNPNPDMNLFGMITTAGSRAYTPIALRSFFAHTPAGRADEFILIDNDGDFELPDDVPADRIRVIRPPAPQGFAQNANLLLARARERGADLFILNNDLVFTQGWLEPLLANRRSLMSPMSNAQVAHSVGRFSTRPAMDLADYVGHERDIETIAGRHRSAGAGYRVVSSLAFFCIRIPRAVYEIVGDFDEQFGKGGGEDRDYAVRAWIAGIPQEFANGSYVLHFQGKSTWRGPETEQEQRARDTRYLQAFEKKWGAALTYAFIRGDWNLFRSDARLARHLERDEFTPIVRQLRSRPSIDAFVARQRSARFGAVCCVYDDDSWLAPAIESVYDACETIWFLVSDTPWHGEPSDQTAVTERIRALPDPGQKIRVVRGQWPDEASQRNEGLRVVAEAGLEYCFVLDADEIYDARQLQRAMALVRENPQVDCWRLSCFTYWKSYRFRVDPPERITAAVFVRPGAGRFVENRTFQAERSVALPLDIAAFHHMSYARSDEQILRKITTFGHAREVVPGWYENVWRKWDEDRSLQNLNPCWPAAYHKVVEQPYEALPPVVRRLWDAGR